MWTLVLLLSTGQQVQANYPTQQACEAKRQEYVIQMSQTSSYLNGLMGALQSKVRGEELALVKSRLKAQYPKARVDQTFTINTANCLSF
jgi:hypothetical protein